MQGKCTLLTAAEAVWATHVLMQKQKYSTPRNFPLIIPLLGCALIATTANTTTTTTTTTTTAALLLLLLL